MHRTTTRRLISPVPRFLLYLLLLSLLTACQGEHRYSQQLLQFGTLFDITLISDDEALTGRTFERIEALLKKRQRQWHAWQDSDLKRFNDALRNNIAGGHSIEVPPSLRQLIADSKKYYHLTDGRFNPALGALIAAWGFHQSHPPDQQRIDKIRHNIPGMDDLIIEGNRARSTNAELQLDFGAIAKGLAIRQIATLISRQGIDDFIINGGGDIYATAPHRPAGWRIAIENPFYAEQHAQHVIGSINLLQPDSVFTSGNYRRFAIDENGIKRHHIIDPKSGAPSRDISSVTVITPDPVVADVAATTLMMTPLNELATMAQKLGIEDFLIISEQHRAYLSASMNARITWQDDNHLQRQIVQQIAGETSHKLAE